MFFDHLLNRLPLATIPPVQETPAKGTGFPHPRIIEAYSTNCLLAASQHVRVVGHTPADRTFDVVLQVLQEPLV